MGLRQAHKVDIEAIEGLIARAVMGLMGHEYDEAARRASIGALFGVDRQVIEDGTYYVLERQGAIVGAGGWSFRRALFGGDATSTRDQGRADPQHEAAHIRAYYVDPDHSRSGIATLILRHSELQASQAGFRRLALGATLTGVPFYERHGYVKGPRFTFLLPGDVPFVLQNMTKSLAPGASANPPTQVSR
ncbi:GNAT family N-acetyltransferase [Lichenicoccus sp.]|uniref:GNAT family N-acetyltransferase n=1 Tax=Lichenicoccus sp. TaxID=2781899 RepID=UPI003D0D5AC1